MTFRSIGYNFLIVRSALKLLLLYCVAIKNARVKTDLLAKE
jgi:hypothetical protein